MHPDKARFNELHTFVLPDLPSFELPPLPPITDDNLRTIAFTHTSLRSKRNEANSFDTDDLLDNYEKLEHVGDGILGGIIVVLLHDLFPNLREGPATILKTHLVKNTTLAQLADRYGLSDRLLASESSYQATKMQVKTRGSLFESYIAGVFYSYLLQGQGSQVTPTKEEEQPTDSQTLPQVSKASVFESNVTVNVEESKSSARSEEEVKEQQDDSVSTTSSKERRPPTLITLRKKAQDLFAKKPVAAQLETSVKETPRSPPESDNEPAKVTQVASSSSQTPVTPGQAFDYLGEWLRPLFTPLAHFAMDQMRQKYKELDEGVLPSNEANVKAGGMKSVLLLHTQMKGWNTPVYESSSFRTEHSSDLSWKITCVVTDRNGNEWRSEATRLNKKTARNAAAYKVCVQLGLFK